MSTVAWSLLILALSLASVHSTWWEAALWGAGMAGSLQILALIKPGERMTRVWSALVFMGFSALLIDELHGMIEMHFSIFVLLAFLLFYADWLPLVVAAGAIAVHHLGFHVLQAAGYPVWVFPHLCGVGMVFVHAGFVVFETVLLVYMAIQHERSGIESGQVIAMLNAVMADDVVDLRVTSQVETGSAGQFGKLIASLRNLVERIVENSETVAGKGEGIALSSTAVARASDQQKQQIEQVAISMQEMQEAISEISRNSQEIALAMSRSQEMAKDGGKVVQNTIAAVEDAANAVRGTGTIVEELERSSGSIGKIVETIKEIAEQTNLLALNASIEAARAGESGRGFAVVAGEVRTLAERTSRATGEIASVITSIQAKTGDAMSSMQHGKDKFSETTKTAERAGAALRDIIEAAQLQNEMVSHIASASTEQKAVTERVGEIIGEISKVADQSATGAGESAEACRDLEIKAVELKSLLSQFVT